ncbi:MAG: DsbA family oxidoreductase [Lysobacterales bacterium]
MTKPLRIDIVSDTVCPWCFVGKRHLEAALAARPEVAVDCRWQPFQLNPDMPLEGVDRETHWKQKFGNSDRLAGMVEQLREVGASLGLAFAFDAITRQPNTLKSHTLLHHLDGQWERQNQLKENILEGFFVSAVDIGDDDTLVKLSAGCGISEEVCRSILEGDLSEVRKIDEQYRQMGVTGVPTIIFDGKAALVGAQPPEALIEAIDKFA